MLRLVNDRAAATPRPSSRADARRGSHAVRTAPIAARPQAPGRGDPRWSFAVLAASRLEGGRAAILRPEQRDRLMRTARALGLRPFDATLIIAVVQDAARRGEAPGQPGGGGPGFADRLSILPVPSRATPAGPGVSGIIASAFFLATALVGLAIVWVQMG